jgi:hypothetical protein
MGMEVKKVYMIEETEDRSKPLTLLLTSIIVFLVIDNGICTPFPNAF